MGPFQEDSESEGTTHKKLLREPIKPRKKTPNLLVPVSDCPPDRLHWLGVSFGTTPSLFNFWRKAHFRLVYLRQTANDITGEHTVIMLRELPSPPHLSNGRELAPQWTRGFVEDARRRVLQLLSFKFRDVECGAALGMVDLPGKGREVIANAASAPESSTSVVVGGQKTREGQSLTWEEATCYFLPHDLLRLEAYSRNMVDYHLIMDLIPTLATLFFQHRFPESNLSYVQAAVLLGVGLQRKTVDEVSTELNTPTHQLLALFNKSMRKFNAALKKIQEKHVEGEMEPSFAKAEQHKKVCRFFYPPPFAEIVVQSP
jgi:N-acetyltransferase 10